MQFSELGLSQEVLKAVEEMGFKEATQIQAESIPILLTGKDVIGRSNTGTGKTAAFGLPAIDKIQKDIKGVQVLILCPTRELAMQASEEIKRFSKFMPWVKPCAVYGGASMDKQIFELRRGANIVVGTPGRVMDHLGRRTLKLENLVTIILDEADEMLNMGFKEDIEEILKSVPEERQTVLFSATMPPAIMNITKEFQTDPALVKVVSKERTVETITQYYYEVPMGRKTDALQLLLSLHEPKLSIIFCNTKKMVDELTEGLNQKGFKASGIHGDMKQAARSAVMDRFKSGRTSILIATDVAARGIDVDDVDAVFNYDIPQDYEYYIHRIGRTGRAGRSGVAFTLTSGRKQMYDMRDIQKFIKAQVTLQELPTSAQIREKKLKKFSEKLAKVVADEKNNEYQGMLNELVESGLTVEMVATALLSMQVGKEMKHVPHFDNLTNSRVRNHERVQRKDNFGNKTKVVLSVGRQQRIAPNFILGALVETTGLKGNNFGKIDIYDRHTTVEIPNEEKDHIISSMTGSKINGNVVTAKLVEDSSGGFSSHGGGSHSRRDYKPRNGRKDERKARFDRFKRKSNSHKKEG